MSLKFFLSILVLLLGIAVTAQVSYKHIEPLYELEHLKLNNKEDVGDFKDAVADREGFIWLSGSIGLSVFDGHSLISYTNKSNRYPFKTTSNANFGVIQMSNAGLLYLQEVNSNRCACFNPGS